MVNFFKRINECRELAKMSPSVFDNISIEYAEKSCTAFRKSAVIVSIAVLFISTIIFLIWETIGIIVLFLACIYIIGYFIYYPKFKRDLLKRVKK